MNHPSFIVSNDEPTHPSGSICVKERERGKNASVPIRMLLEVHVHLTVAKGDAFVDALGDDARGVSKADDGKINDLLLY